MIMEIISCFVALSIVTYIYLVISNICYFLTGQHPDCGKVKSNMKESIRAGIYVTNKSLFGKKNKNKC